MGYTPTTWNTGDTITASALNKIEQGIADGGGGGGNPMIRIKTHGFGSYSHFFSLAICTEDNGQYLAEVLLLPDGSQNTLRNIIFYGGDSDVIVYDMPVPQNMYLTFIRPNTASFTTTVSGNISQTTVTVNYGSTADAYIITGDCEINITE